MRHEVNILRKEEAQTNNAIEYSIIRAMHQIDYERYYLLKAPAVQSTKMMMTQSISIPPQHIVGFFH
jgi:hypothetical protein